MSIASKLDAALPTVADTWDELRGCDVYRLLNEALQGTRRRDAVHRIHAAADVVRSHRPDLSSRIDEAVEYLAEDYAPVS